MTMPTTLRILINLTRPRNRVFAYAYLREMSKSGHNHDLRSIFLYVSWYSIISKRSTTIDDHHPPQSAPKLIKSHEILQFRDFIEFRIISSTVMVSVIIVVDNLVR